MGRQKIKFIMMMEGVMMEGVMMAGFIFSSSDSLEIYVDCQFQILFP
jgi:hypothetical protein